MSSDTPPSCGSDGDGGSGGPGRRKNGAKMSSQFAFRPPSNGVRVRERLRAFVPYVDKPFAFWREDPDSHVPIPINTSWINVDVVLSWIRACEQHHAKRCATRVTDSLGDTAPAWLVDVRRLCLVPGRPGMRYFALSYVWGPSSQDSSADCALRSNIDALQRESAFDNFGLPKTISHAMQLTAMLHEDYMWVDRLCIVQDAGWHMQDQLRSMPSIYNNAVATIVAAGGIDADDGLKGIRDVTGARCLPGSGLEDASDDEPNEEEYVDSDPFGRASCWFVPEKATRVSWMRKSRKAHKVNQAHEALETWKPGLQRDGKDIMAEQAVELTESKWHSRGWTFQEDIFSRRKIVFQGETVNWDCACAAWSEAFGPVSLGRSPDPDYGHSPGGDKGEEDLLDPDCFSSTVPDFLSSPLPDFRRFARLATLFNQRDLTFPEDVFNAFEGIATQLAPKYAGGFVSGLPQMLFDSALLWQPYNTLTRREPKKLSSDEACLPSWSWVGWQGDICSESLRSGYDYMRKNPDEYLEEDESVWHPSSWHTLSTVKWHRLDDDGAAHPIDVTGHTYRDEYASGDDAKELPAGWTHDVCSVSGRPFFRHASDPSREFWYPIPLPPNDGPPPIGHIRCRFIACQTQRAFLRTGDVFGNHRTSLCPCVDLLDREGGGSVGFLRVPREAGQEGLVKDGATQELIELSAGRVRRLRTEAASFDEWMRLGGGGGGGEDDSGELYEFYNVMAVERRREGDREVAYRRAVGRVLKRAWERLATEVVDVVLG